MVGAHSASSLSDDLFRNRLQRAREGSGQAIGELIESCRDYLLLVANQELGDQLRRKLGASDAVQETFVAAHQRFDQFRGATAEELVGWLRTILRNQLLMAHRHFSAAKRDVRREQTASNSPNPVVDQRPTPHHRAVDAENGLRLRNALSHLSADRRQVILLRNWEQLPFSCVGERLGRSEEAARKLWSRAMKDLKRQLSNESEAESQ